MSLPITKPVGRGLNANTVPLDVAKVQALLTAYYLPRDPAVLIGWLPGVYQSAIGDAILRFQKESKLSFQDGRVDPGGSTWRKLDALFPNLPIPPLPPSPQRSFLTRHDDTSGFRGTTLNPPNLANATGIDLDWEIKFGGTPGRPVDTWYYETAPGTKVRYIGVCCPKGVRDPDAYLLYFHHHAKVEPGFYQSDIDFLNFGIGDYMIGRMQAIRQLARSFKNVAIVVACPVMGAGSEFVNNEQFVRDVLMHIDSDILGIESAALPPLMVAGYSSGAEDMCTFLAKCPNLAGTVKAAYDFDGGWIGSFNPGQLNGIAKRGAQVIRYMGGTVPELGKNEDPRKYLLKYQGTHPTIVPLPLSRWKQHSEFQFSRFASPVGWWMHAHIPSCMLLHALNHTTFLR